MVYNILDFGAVPDGETRSTKAIQRAIDKCTKTSGTVLIPAGAFLSGTLRLRSDVELHLEHGSRLISCLDKEDMIDYFKEDSDDNEVDGWEGGCFLFALHEKNIAITGTGVIDGRGRKVFFDDDPEHAFEGSPLAVTGFRPRMSYLEDVENLTVSDVTFYDSAFWTLHMAGCRKVRINNIVIENNKRGPNTDGIDPDCCQDVIIRGCRIVSGDDSVVIKSTTPMYKRYGDCRDIIVSDCILSSNCSGIKIGTETYGDIHDVIVTDCILRDCIRGIGIWSRDGGEIYNIRISGIQGNTRNFFDSRVRTTGVWNWWGEGEPIAITATKREGIDRIPGRVHDITMEQMYITCEGPVMMLGEEYSPIERISVTESAFVFKNQSGKKGIVVDERPSPRGRYPEKTGCKLLRNASEVTVDARFEVDESMKDLLDT
ncbi:MAG: right-handed parallel beta-helix repeat-containing protein [Butyrivibrio sp.]|nr:right-handed parallel beta-helix repeat-containing protein [Butyrivibrio sp.]MBR1641254.1 right-handed parallel beta-helix repeat-containing protein [Butyrivibrio sp.]